MANTTLTNLPTVTNLNGTEPLLGVQSGSSVQITTGQIVSLATGGGGVGPLPVIAGGTGDTTLTQYGLLYGNGTSPVSALSPPAGSNYVLVGSAGTAPSWQSTIPVTAGVDSVAFGTTGLTPVAATSGVVSIAFGSVPTAAGIYSPNTNQIALSTNSVQRFLIDATGNSTFSGTTTAPFFIANGTITGSLSQGAYAYGTLGYSDTNIYSSFASSINSFTQAVIQNTNSGASASANHIVSNNLGTSSAYFGEFGINSSGFTGSGSFNLPNAVYLDATSGDLVIGTTTANAIRFVVNGATTDTITLPSTGNLLQADFSNATLTSRLAFQSSTTNSTTGIYALPNGSSTAASWQAANASDPTNAQKILIATNGTTDVQLVSGANGTGTSSYLPLAFYNGGLGRFVIGTAGQFGVGPTATVSYGTSGQTFISGGAAAAPSWGILGVSGGGTGQSSNWTQYGAIYASTTSVLASTAAGTTGQPLLANTTSGPAFGNLALGTANTNVSGTLTVTNGGTGAATFTTNGVIYGNTTSALGVTAAGTTGQVFVGTTGSAPSWTTALTGITTLTATGAITFNTTTNNQSYTTTGAGTITISSGTVGSIDNMTIGGTTRAAGTFTTVTAPTVAGGATASSTLTLESTSGAGTTDSIQFLVASQAEAARYDTSGAYFFKRVANAVNATATLTVAQLRGGIITSTTAATVTMTMPTGTVLDTAGTGLAATTLPTNATIQFTIKNTGATNAITVAVATGVTNGGVAADLTIAASATATYQLTKTTTNTFVLYKQ